MKFPITRETLQTFDYAKEEEELMQADFEKRFTLLIEQFCKEFERDMRTSSREKKFVWRKLSQLNVNITGPRGFHTFDYLPKFIDKLKEIFIGCDIIIDPLKTYLIIDWS